jgi:immune inhibitor A
VRYDIEEGFDFAFLEATTDGTTWTPLMTDRSAPAADDSSGFNASGAGIDGTTHGAWVDLAATVPAGTTGLRVRYQTDGGIALSGLQVDSIAVGGQIVGTAETDEGWAFDGFRTTTGSETRPFAHYYVAENRQYVGNDRSLRTAYNFGFLTTEPDLVETYPYENGLLVNYWDTSYSDNDVGEHPGAGLLLPVDAHPVLEHSADGHLLRPRILSYDSTFGLEATTPITVHKDGRPTSITSKPAVPVFDDTKSWWSDRDEHASTGDHVGRHQPGWYGVDVPRTGTTIRVKSVATTGFMQVEVAPK